jgi:putative ATP-dependent endonuclease of the OLD family
LQIAKLEIENLRGICEGTVQFSSHTVFVGANNCGKTTVVEALALLFGRDRMIRQLTEHDFYGSNPHDSPHFSSAQPLHRFAPIPYQIWEFCG